MPTIDRLYPTDDIADQWVDTTQAFYDLSPAQQTQVTQAATDSQSLWGSFQNALTGILTAVYNDRQNSRLFDLNVARARQGLPPVNASAVLANPAAQGIDNSKMLMYGAFALGAAVLLATLLKRR